MAVQFATGGIVPAGSVTLRDGRAGCDGFVIPRPKWSGPWRLIDGQWQRGYLTMSPPMIVTARRISPDQARSLKEQFERAMRDNKPMVMSECDIKRVEVEVIKHGPKVEE